MIRASCWVLSIGATGTAICLSVLAGWQRGGSLAERWVWVAIGVVLVASAHLLPALVRDLPYRIRAVAGALWLACMLAACYGHATFFLLAQRHAGELRSATAPIVDAAQAHRSLTAVMAERASIAAQWATANAQRCTGNCTTLEARRVTLTAKLDALEAEASEIRRRQSSDDRAAAQRDALAADAVTARLAALLDTTVARVDLLSGLAFAAVLEGVAGLLWTITLRSQPSVTAGTAVTESHAPAVTSQEPSIPDDAQKSAPVTPLPTPVPDDSDVNRLAQDVAAGRVRPTVTDIRRHLSCSQARASALRRQLATLDST
ncbi:hypothetical protein B7R78_0002400 [Ralstonia solanacearum]|uniref:hypothetical protein n=1 Tax=Ralstonia solanacearum TaxID=305 RepID=UPI0011415148|nr:hypothetical protein [Ralstonia solanacearum]MBT1536038.1 hypothetical protein [Ralstonia solanacearum]